MNVTASARVAPMRAIKPKNSTYAQAEQSNASSARAAQASPPGIRAGQLAAAGTASINAAALWLPAAIASGDTPSRVRLV